MYNEKRFALHEAAHSIIAIVVGSGISNHGIDLNASTSVEGAFGNAGANLFVYDPVLGEEEQRNRLMANLGIIVAGAVSDSLALEIPLREALRRQPGDEKVATDLLSNSSLLDIQDQKQKAELIEELLNASLKQTQRSIQDPAVWEKIEAVARAALKSKGRLSKRQIETIAANFDKRRIRDAERN